jgi:hypothetical protein
MIVQDFLFRWCRRGICRYAKWIVNKIVMCTQVCSKCKLISTVSKFGIMLHVLRRNISPFGGLLVKIKWVHRRVFFSIYSYRSRKDTGLCYILLYKRLNIQPNNVRGAISCLGCVCLLGEDLCSLRFFFSGICVAPIYSFLCCVFCFVWLRFASYVARVSALSFSI